MSLMFLLRRMMWVAAFAVSVYGSCQARAGHKPFNPLLGETFECVREDRGFRYVAEQVGIIEADMIIIYIIL